MFFTSWLFTSFKKVFKKVCYIKFLRPPSNSREAKNPVFAHSILRCACGLTCVAVLIFSPRPTEKFK